MTDDWRSLAACSTWPTEVFFPTRGDRRGMAKARAICAGCPVQSPCLELALDAPEYGDHGVWGGLSENERSDLRRSRPNRDRRFRDLAPHGTGAAHRKHRRDGTPPCAACREWKRVDSVLRRDRERERAS